MNMRSWCLSWIIRFCIIWKLYQMIGRDIMKVGNPASTAIPGQFPLLRTMQYTLHWAMPEHVANQEAEPPAAAAG